VGCPTIRIAHERQTEGVEHFSEWHAFNPNTEAHTPGECTFAGQI
jgi:hypothetical protein